MELDINTLKSLLKAKEDALHKLKTSFDEFKEEAKEYEQELEADNEHKEKEIETLLQKLETATKKIEEYKKEISQSNKIIEREQAKVESQSQEITAMKAKIVSLEQLNEDLERDLRNVKFEKQELSEKLESIEETFVIERENLEEQFNKKNEELEKFRQDIHEYEDEIALWKRKSIQRSLSGRTGVLKGITESTETSKTGSKRQRENMVVSRNLYAKPSQDGLPKYINIEDKCVLIEDQDDSNKTSKSYPIDEIFRDVEDINLQEILDSPLNTFLGRNLSFLICGPKKTDKKQIKYKILQDLIRMFRAVSMKNDFEDKVCKISIKTINQSREFIMGNIESEQQLYEYIKSLKEMDLSKIKDTEKIARKKKVNKQITVNLYAQRRVQNNAKPNGKNLLMTRINILTANTQDPECVSFADKFMKRENSISKFLFLTIDPSENSAIPANMLTILEKTENDQLTENALVTPVQYANNDSSDCSSEYESTSSEEKAYVPRKIRSDAAIQESIDLCQNKRQQPRNHRFSMQIANSEIEQGPCDLVLKPGHKSHKSEFSSKLSNLFSFVQKLTKPKMTQSASKSSHSDRDISTLVTEPDMPDSKVVRKLIVDLE